MRNNDDKRIKTEVPFLQDNTVLFIDGSSEAADYNHEPIWEQFAFHFRYLGYKFLFIPELVRHLSEDVVHYMFPGYDGNAETVALYSRIQELTKLGNQTGLLYKQNGSTYFHAVSDSSEEEKQAGVQSLIDYLRETQEPERSVILCGIPSRDDECFELDVDNLISARKLEIPRKKKSKGLQDSGANPIHWSFTADPDHLDPRTWAILEAWDRIEREFGITIQDMDILLGYRVKLSRLTISRQNKIQLIDWEDSPEVKMDDITKALYFFFLKHPEGAVLKELEPFKPEILKIYMDISGRDDVQGIYDSIDRLLNPYSDGRNTSMSRIKKAFKDIVGDRIAQFYYIDGKAGGNYTIQLDRDMVLWER